MRTFVTVSAVVASLILTADGRAQTPPAGACSSLAGLTQSAPPKRSQTSARPAALSAIARGAVGIGRSPGRRLADPSLRQSRCAGKSTERVSRGDAEARSEDKSEVRRSRPRPPPSQDAVCSVPIPEPQKGQTRLTNRV